MNKKQSQSGSGHLVIIIILVLALLGALGFIFYQNFIVIKTETPTPVPVIVDDTKYFAITEWGIKGEYIGDSLNYEIVGSSAQFPSIAECPSRILKTISKYSADDIIMGHSHFGIAEPKSAADFYDSNYFGSDMKKIGDNYYVLEQGISDVCSDDPAIYSKEGRALSDVVNFFSTLREQ